MDVVKSGKAEDKKEYVNALHHAYCLLIIFLSLLELARTRGNKMTAWVSNHFSDEPIGSIMSE